MVAEGRDVADLAASFRQQIDALDMALLHDGIETPLVRVLAKMEVAGIGIDRVELTKISDELKTSAAGLQATVQELAGHEFNVNSTQQLRTVLYDELGLRPGKKTKTGYSTDAQTLESLRGEHPIIDALLSYREVEKLRSTYGENLLAEVADDGRIHASFRQTVARDGAHLLGSSEPAQHPGAQRAREAVPPGLRARRGVFVPGGRLRPGRVARDRPSLRRRRADRGDDLGVRRAPGRCVGGVPGAARRGHAHPARILQNGLLRAGLRDGGLRAEPAPGCAGRRGGRHYGELLRRLPERKAYMDETVAEARVRGGTCTEFGRLRPLPDLSSSNYRVRLAAERQAMNAGIQGLAADIFKLALVRLDRSLEEAELGSRLVLQVHDEVIVEVAAGEEAEASRLTEDALTGAANLKVPLTISMAIGPSWAAAKG